MKKILFPILVLAIILGMSNCEQKDKYDDLFDDDNPLIGTWENKFGNGSEFIVFIDDSSMYEYGIFDGILDTSPDDAIRYHYDFDRTPVPSPSWMQGSTEMVISVKREKDTITFYYCPDNKKIYYDEDSIYTKIKK